MVPPNHRQRQPGHGRHLSEHRFGLEVGTAGKGPPRVSPIHQSHLLQQVATPHPIVGQVRKHPLGGQVHGSVVVPHRRTARVGRRVDRETVGGRQGLVAVGPRGRQRHRVFLLALVVAAKLGAFQPHRTTVGAVVLGARAVLGVTSHCTRRRGLAATAGGEGFEATWADFETA